jgi:hypothetical protein
MFYSAQLLTKKGPLGTIWIAAHLEKRLKRNQIFETSIPASVGECAPSRDTVIAATHADPTSPTPTPMQTPALSPRVPCLTLLPS